MFSIQSAFKKKADLKAKQEAQLWARRQPGQKEPRRSIIEKQTDRIKDIHNEVLQRNFTESDKMPDSVLLQSKTMQPNVLGNMTQAIDKMTTNIFESWSKGPRRNGSLKIIKKLNTIGSPKFHDNVLQTRPISQKCITNRSDTTNQVNVQFNNLYFGITALAVNQEQKDKNIDRFGFESRIANFNKVLSPSIKRSVGVSPRPSMTQKSQKSIRSIGPISEFKHAAAKLRKPQSRDFLELPLPKNSARTLPPIEELNQEFGRSQIMGQDDFKQKQYSPNISDTSENPKSSAESKFKDLDRDFGGSRLSCSHENANSDLDKCEPPTYKEPIQSLSPEAPRETFIRKIPRGGIPNRKGNIRDQRTPENFEKYLQSVSRGSLGLNKWRFTQDVPNLDSWPTPSTGKHGCSKFNSPILSMVKPRVCALNSQKPKSKFDILFYDFLHILEPNHSFYTHKFALGFKIILLGNFIISNVFRFLGIPIPLKFPKT